ncbi:HesB/IscA family protein [Rickettsia endosymbiont of Cardiosporidium cionae]|uniref:HesB/IscA family protein n=1 Tax=Rickettsia endosymbiont of Cardiosporidium cionae TaxID=2777155 RepID=UPI0018932D0C|nr:iron-sulfur cluster assembly accessory protein [Rickettsia endosymbiont of Cardiosporidium cionae]KAF8818831.1 iron-sulfur cluster assembly accessory protein [Rickettsia endosymbiont of Cardiosporidium cionae]
MTNNQVLFVTKEAELRVQYLLKQRKSPPAVGIRIGVKSGGCSGFKYFIEYADKIDKFDEVVKGGDVTILIDQKALFFLLGSKMDYIEEQFKSGFVFINPNEKSKCGCGNSFSL